MSIHPVAVQPTAIAEHDVETLGSVYRGMYHANLTVARALAGHVPAISPLDDKWLLMRAVYVFTEHCQTLAIRLAELRCPPRLLGRPDDAIETAGRAIASAPNWAGAARFLREFLVELHEFYEAARDRATTLAVAHDRAMLIQLVSDVRQLQEFAAAHPASEAGQPLSVPAATLVGRLIDQGPPVSPSGALSLPVPACPRRAYPDWATFVQPRPPKPADALESGEPPVETAAQVGAFLRHGLQIEFIAMDVPLRNMAEFADLPLQFYRDMARHAHDEMRHTLMLFDEFEGLGVDYRAIPYEDPDYYELLMTEDLTFRLIVLSRTGEAEAIETFNYLVPRLRESGFESVASMLDHALSDEVRHAAYGNKWLRFLVGDDDDAVEAVTAQVLERFNEGALRIGLGERAIRDVDYLRTPRSTPVDGPLREMAGFSKREVSSLVDASAGRPAPE